MWAASLTRGGGATKWVVVRRAMTVVSTGYPLIHPCTHSLPPPSLSTPTSTHTPCCGSTACGLDATDDGRLRFRDDLCFTGRELVEWLAPIVRSESICVVCVVIAAPDTHSLAGPVLALGVPCVFTFGSACDRETPQQLVRSVGLAPGLHVFVCG